MTTKIFFVAIAVFLGLAQFANAGVILYVHFGDIAPKVVTTEQELQTTYDPNGNSLTASIYLHLTNRTDWAAPALTTIYGYRFSVRHDNSLALDLNGRVEFLPDGFDVTSVPALTSEGNLLLGFNGLIGSPTDNFAGKDFYKVATLKFTFTTPSNLLDRNTKLVEAGDFYSSPDVNLSDAIVTDDYVAIDKPFDKVEYFIERRGGTFSVGSVPEPNSAIVIGGLGLLALARRKHFNILLGFRRSLVK